MGNKNEEILSSITSGILEKLEDIYTLLDNDMNKKSFSILLNYTILNKVYILNKDK